MRAMLLLLLLLLQLRDGMGRRRSPCEEGGMRFRPKNSKQGKPKRPHPSNPVFPDVSGCTRPVMLFFTIAPWLHLLKTTVRYASRCRQAVPESVAGVGTASMSLSQNCESAAGSGVGAC